MRTSEPWKCFHGQDAQFPKNPLCGELPVSRSRHLVAPPQESPHSVVHVCVHVMADLSYGTIGEVVDPPPQDAVEATYDFLPG